MAFSWFQRGVGRGFESILDWMQIWTSDDVGKNMILFAKSDDVKDDDDDDNDDDDEKGWMGWQAWA